MLICTPAFHYRWCINIPSPPNLSDAYERCKYRCIWCKISSTTNLGDLCTYTRGVGIGVFNARYYSTPNLSVAYEIYKYWCIWWKLPSIPNLTGACKRRKFTCEISFNARCSDTSDNMIGKCTYRNQIWIKHRMRHSGKQSKRISVMGKCQRWSKSHTILQIILNLMCF